MRERLSNDTVVDLDRLPTDQLIHLIEEREAAMLLDQRPDQSARQGDIDRFMAEIIRRQLVSPECGEVDYGK